jgi:hypothetical protein
MRQTLLLALSAFVCIPTAFPASGVKARQRLTTTVCVVLKHEVGYRSRSVEIRSEIEADGKHGAMLTDPRCPTRGIGLGVSPPDADESVTALEEMLRGQGGPGTSGRRVTGNFFGRLVRDGKTKHLRIEINKVTDLTSVNLDRVTGEAPSLP